MKNSSAHSSGFLHRWLSRTSNPTTQYHGHSDQESESTGPLSPPPLTDSSSTAASSSVLLTPRTAGYPPPVSKSSRAVSGIKPCTPPTRYTALPVATTSGTVSLTIRDQPPPALTVARTEVKLHRLLHHDPTRRTLKFDVSLPTSFILQYPSSTSPSAMVVRRQRFQPHTIHPRLEPIPEQALVQLAITPPVTHLRIITDLLPWSIIIRGKGAMPDDPRSFVRVIDVLDGIYISLREGVSSDEWNRVPKPFRDQAKKAYFKRCQASLPFTLTGYEEKQGVRRVDYLKDKAMFLGLTLKIPDKEDKETTWMVMLAPRSN